MKEKQLFAWILRRIPFTIIIQLDNSEIYKQAQDNQPWIRAIEPCCTGNTRGPAWCALVT